ncbi:MAG: hypothetical protein LM582_10140 [Desulfurococcaceae archaeon]|nr:hypothetical protein [Desulfurococcaceae archaeon]
MEVEEYRKLAENPITFMLEVIAPRMFKALRKPSSPKAYTVLIKLGLDTKKFNNVMNFISFETELYRCIVFIKVLSK